MMIIFHAFTKLNENHFFGLVLSPNAGRIPISRSSNSNFSFGISTTDTSVSIFVSGSGSDSSSSSKYDR